MVKDNPYHALGVMAGTVAALRMGIEIDRDKVADVLDESMRVLNAFVEENDK